MPGDLEALPILPERAYGVKAKTLIPQGFLVQQDRTARRHQAGVKGAEGGEADPCRRRVQAARPSRQWTKAPAPPAPYKRPKCRTRKLAAKVSLSVRQSRTRRPRP
jgi:hypothetical protein